MLLPHKYAQDALVALENLESHYADGFPKEYSAAIERLKKQVAANKAWVEANEKIHAAGHLAYAQQARLSTVNA